MPNLEGSHLAVSRCGLVLKLLEEVSVRCELVGRKVRRFQGACDGVALGGRPRRVRLTERGSVERLAAETVVGAEPLPEHIVDVSHAVGERLSLLAQVREIIPSRSLVDSWGGFSGGPRYDSRWRSPVWRSPWPLPSRSDLTLMPPNSAPWRSAHRIPIRPAAVWLWRRSMRGPPGPRRPRLAA